MNSRGTPWKINIEPKNGGLVQIIFLFRVIFRFQPFIFQGVWFPGVSTEFRRPKGEKVHWPSPNRWTFRENSSHLGKARWFADLSENSICYYYWNIFQVFGGPLKSVCRHCSNKGTSWLLAAWWEVLLESLLIDLSNLPDPKRRCHLPHTPTEGPTTSLIDVNLKVTSTVVEDQSSQR